MSALDPNVKPKDWSKVIRHFWLTTSSTGSGSSSQNQQILRSFLSDGDQDCGVGFFFLTVFRNCSYKFFISRYFQTANQHCHFRACSTESLFSWIKVPTTRWTAFSNLRGLISIFFVPLFFSRWPSGCWRRRFWIRMTWWSCWGSGRLLRSRPMRSLWRELEVRRRTQHSQRVWRTGTRRGRSAKRAKRSRWPVRSLEECPSRVPRFHITTTLTISQKFHKLPEVQRLVWIFPTHSYLELFMLSSVPDTDVLANIGSVGRSSCAPHV